jgi:glycosyltransferase involved in cell wall biosynthesis
MTVETTKAPLRIAVLGNFESAHTRRWIRVFVERGHDVHAISYYTPRAELPGVQVHVLSGQIAPSAGGPRNYSPVTAYLRHYAPHALLRAGYGVRYLRAGLAERLKQIKPDVFHGHFVVEHGFYGALCGFHPYVVSAWGSDLYVESHKPLSRRIASWTLGRADLVTAADPAMAARALELGASPQRVKVVRLGVDDLFLSGPRRGVNLVDAEAAPLAVISDRALEPLYNVDVILRALARLRANLAGVKLLVANDGSQRARLERLAQQQGQAASVSFLGHLAPEALKAALESAHVYVSVPESDSLAVSTMEAMAVGSFPIVSDLPSQDGWVRQRINGLRVPAGDVELLADALYEALLDAALRRRAAAINRGLVESEGVLVENMLAMEQEYYRLAGRRGAAPAT